MADKDIKEIPMTESIPPRININEALMTSNLSDMQKAGFKAYMGVVQYMRRNAWEQKIKEYRDK